MSLKQVPLLFLCTGFHFFYIISADLTYYGNEAKERSTSGLDSSIQPAGPRIWIDDPLNCDSCPRWGYLQTFHVYIHAVPSSVPLPRLFLQIWSNTTVIGNYTLKWQKSLDNYQPGKLHEVTPDAGHVVEVNQFDRIGFTSEGNGSPVALDFETDDVVTTSTAHRTYFRLLYRDNYVLPAIGDSRYVDNNALRGRFSIGILLDNAPPRKRSEVYVGHELIRRSRHSGSLLEQVMVDDSIELVSGQVTAFYFRLAQLANVISVQLYIWQKIANSNNYILTYSRSSTLDPSPEKTYNLSFIDGPLVNSSHRFGWNIPDGLFHSSSESGGCRSSIAGRGASYSVGQTYAFDGLAWPYNMSIGVIVDRQLTSAVSSSSPTPSPSTSTRTTSTSTSAAPLNSIRQPPVALSTSTTKSSAVTTSSSSSSSSSTSSSSPSSSSSSSFSNVVFSNNGLSSPPPPPSASPAEPTVPTYRPIDLQARRNSCTAVHRSQLTILCLIVALRLLVTSISN